jgi:CheY-like chemotaxis protein
MDHKNLRVLVVEDDPYTRHLTVRMLRNIGITEIAEASDGHMATELYGESWPHVVVCDVTMQPMDGVEFFQLLLNERQSLGQVAPVIFLTSHAESGVIAQLRRMGAAGYLLKPASAAALGKRIDMALASQGDPYAGTPLSWSGRATSGASAMAQ